MHPVWSRSGETDMYETIYLTNNYPESVLRIIREECPESFCLIPETGVQLPEKPMDADYLLAGGRTRVDEKLLKGMPHLKMIQRTGVGLDSLDLNAIRERGIPLYVNQGVNAQSVAEYALMSMLACLRRLPDIQSEMCNGQWKKQGNGIKTRELRGKTVGLIGMGHIGRSLVGLLEPFQVRILYFDVVGVISHVITNSSSVSISLSLRILKISLFLAEIVISVS